jgi:hypothetical protein
MTEPAWRLWIAMPTIYLGAFLSGLRPASWFASRLLPAFAGGTLIALLDVARLPFALHAGALLLFDAALVVLIMYVARTRDYS